MNGWRKEERQTVTPFYSDVRETNPKLLRWISLCKFNLSHSWHLSEFGYFRNKWASSALKHFQTASQRRDWDKVYVTRRRFIVKGSWKRLQCEAGTVPRQCCLDVIIQASNTWGLTLLSGLTVRWPLLLPPRNSQWLPQDGRGFQCTIVPRAACVGRSRKEHTVTVKKSVTPFGPFRCVSDREELQNEFFSFWAATGRPGKKRQFVPI